MGSRKIKNIITRICCCQEETDLFCKKGSTCDRGCEYVFLDSLKKWIKRPAIWRTCCKKCMTTNFKLPVFISGMYVKLPENMFVFSKTFRSYVDITDCITKVAPEDMELTERNSSYENLSPVQKEICFPMPKISEQNKDKKQESTEQHDTKDDKDAKYSKNSGIKEDDSENSSLYEGGSRESSPQCDTTEDESENSSDTTETEGTGSEFSDNDNYYPELFM